MLEALLILIVSIMFAGCIFLKRRADEINDRDHLPLHIEAVVLHTYHGRKPRYGFPTLRGRLVLRPAWLTAYRCKCPLIIPAGRVNDGRMQGDDYRDSARRIFGHEVPIFTGEDPTARDTAGEVKEALRIIRKSGARFVMVVGSEPHLFRIQRLWDQACTKDLYLTFSGEYVPPQYYLWELAMLVAEALLPPGSRRRALALNAVGR